jgi:MFS superfamily sulfate permease-like transporter
MPTPYVPFLDGELLRKVFPDAVGIAIISYVISLSIARIVANKHKYQVQYI